MLEPLNKSGHKRNKREELFTFPSHEKIVAFLQSHPLTKDPCLRENGVIDTVAKFFENKKKFSEGITIGLQTVLSDLSTRLALDSASLILVQQNLINALRSLVALSHTTMEEQVLREIETLQAEVGLMNQKCDRSLVRRFFDYFCRKKGRGKRKNI